MLKMRLFKKCYEYALTFNNLTLAGLGKYKEAENACNSYMTLYCFIMENNLLNEFNRFVVTYSETEVNKNGVETVD